MFELIKQGGWLMLPILVCSVIVMAIVIERLWFLRREFIAPARTLPSIKSWIKKDHLVDDKIQALSKESLLGSILAAGLTQSNHSYYIARESMQEKAKHITHELERHLTTLGTVASVAPLLGLLGTVIGMIDVFSIIMMEGTNDPSLLAGGIAKALLTTAAGLSIAIPALMFHRHFYRVIDDLLLIMEKDAINLVSFLCLDPADKVTNNEI